MSFNHTKATEAVGRQQASTINFDLENQAGGCVLPAEWCRVQRWNRRVRRAPMDRATEEIGAGDSSVEYGAAPRVHSAFEVRLKGRGACLWSLTSCGTSALLSMLDMLDGRRIGLRTLRLHFELR